MRRCLNCMNEYPDASGDTCPYCGYVEGTTAAGEQKLPTGTILQGRYIVGTARRIRDIDIFYIGWDAIFDRKVRIQEYFPRYCATRSSTGELSIYDSKKDKFQEGLELFCRQSRELIRLYRDDRVITYNGCFRENKTAYAVTEYREDPTLENWCEGRNLGEEEALYLLQEAIEAVERAHRLGIIHGMIDGKAFWVRGGQLVLKDFGPWRYVSGEPGIVSYGNLGVDTDVYGLARMFCCLLTGEELEDGDHLEADLSRRGVSLSKRTVTAIKHALSHETKSLYQFSQELGGHLGEETEAAFSRNRSKRKEARDSLRVPRWVYLAAGVALVAVAVAAALFFTGVVRPRMETQQSQLKRQEVRVPNVVNQDLEEAKKTLKREGLRLVEGEMVYSNEIPENRITYQSYKENTLVTEDTEVTVAISLGKEKAVMPTVEGLLREEAEKSLKEAGFTDIVIEESEDPGLFQSVLKASETAGDKVEKTKQIVLTVCVSEGGKHGKIVPVPDLSGLDKGTAETALKEAGFGMNCVEEYSEEPEGTVLSQNPGAEVDAEEGTFVTVHVSKGPEKIYMVNVRLETKEEAVSLIEGLGLTVGQVTEQNNDSVPAGKVIKQSVEPDVEVKKGDTVDLVISKGPEPKAQSSKQNQSSKQSTPKQTAPKQTKAPKQTQAAKPAQTAASETAAPVEETSPAEEGQTGPNMGPGGAAPDERKSGVVTGPGGSDVEAAPPETGASAAETTVAPKPENPPEGNTGTGGGASSGGSAPQAEAPPAVTEPAPAPSEKLEGPVSSGGGEPAGGSGEAPTSPVVSPGAAPGSV